MSTKRTRSLPEHNPASYLGHGPPCLLLLSVVLLSSLKPNRKVYESLKTYVCCRDFYTRIISHSRFQVTFPCFHIRLDFSG